MSKAKKGRNELLNLKRIKPKNKNQELVFNNWYQGQHILMHGSAGTGKTFVAMYLALEALFNNNIEKVTIVRSALPSRDIGFMPGTLQEKIAVFEEPYFQICTELFDRGDAYDALKKRMEIDFVTTSFFRGITFRDTVVIFDEFQNTEMQEFSTVFTRMGENCRLIVCGDITQSDLRDRSQYKLPEMLDIMNRMPSITPIEFTTDDIMRSSFVKEFLVAKEEVLGSSI